VSVQPFKTKSGKRRYRVRYYEGGTKAGPQRQRTFDRREDAAFFDASVRRARQLGQLSAELLGSEQSVKDFIEEWWEKYATTYLAPGTLETYAFVLDRWIVPYLGHLRLRDLSAEQVETFGAVIRKAGAGAPTVNRCLGILQGICRRAVAWRRLPANPVVGVSRLRHLRDEGIDARAPEDVEAIRAAIIDGSLLPTGVTFRRPDAALVSVLAYEGLRPAEAFSLQWMDVLEAPNRTRERVRVRRALSGNVVSTTKSARAREPELFGPVAGELLELYLAAGRPGLRELVFPAAKGGYILRQNWRRRVWQPALAAAGIPYFRPYDLRHTCATLLIYEGRTVNEIAEHLGHSDPGFTARTYQHVFKDARHRRGLSIEEAIRQARTGTAVAEVR
jgi:integrase